MMEVLSISSLMQRHLSSPRSDKAWSMFDAGFYSFMVGWGETYLVAFALAMGLSESYGAMLGVFPIAIGALLQLMTSYGAKWVGSPRKWIITCGTFQALSLIVFSLPAWDLVAKPYLFIFFLLIGAIYWGGALSGGPVWNAWITQIIPRTEIRGFLTWRSGIQQISTLLALWTAGIAIEYFGSSPESKIAAFSMLFLFAAGARLFSVFCLSKQTEPKIMEMPQFGLNSLFRWIRNRQVLPILLFSYVTSFAVHTAGPFFSPYMLKELAIDIKQYSMLLAFSLLAKSITGIILNRVMANRSIQNMFLLGVFGIIPLPYLWTLGTSYEYLLFLHILSGMVWSCHELGLSLFLIEHVSHGERSRLLGWANVANAMGMLSGIMMGLVLTTKGHLSANIGLDNYYFIFYLSTAFRILPLLFLGGFLQKLPFKPIYFRIVGVRPHALSLLKPIIARKVRSIPKNESNQ